MVKYLKVSKEVNQKKATATTKKSPISNDFKIRGTRHWFFKNKIYLYVLENTVKELSIYNRTKTNYTQDLAFVT